MVTVLANFINSQGMDLLYFSSCTLQLTLQFFGLILPKFLIS